MLDAGGDVGDDPRDLRLAVGACAVGKHPHRHFVFADAVDAAGKMILGAERDLQKALDDLAVGEDLLLVALALRRRGMIAGGSEGCESVAEREAAQGGPGESAGGEIGGAMRIGVTLPQSGGACKT